MSWMGRSCRRVVGIPLSVMEFRWMDTHIGSYLKCFRASLVLCRSFWGMWVDRSTSLDLYWIRIGIALDILLDSPLALYWTFIGSPLDMFGALPDLYWIDAYWSSIGLYWISIGSLLDLYRISTWSMISNLSLLDLYWMYIGSLLDLYWIYIGSLLDLHWTSIGSLLDLYWIGALLDLYWNPFWISTGYLLEHNLICTGSRLGIGII